MGRCRKCNTEVKPYQIHCPKCGAKNPLLSKEDIKEFKIFKKKFKPVFFIAVIILVALAALLVIQVPVQETAYYKVKESLPMVEPVEIPLGCLREEYRYAVNYVRSQVFADVLKVMCNIENLEEEQGSFVYTATISNKLSLAERKKESTVLLNPHENKTASLYFQEVKAPGQVDYFCKVDPPTKLICKAETGHVLVTDEEEIIKAKQEEKRESLFELLFLKH